MSQRGSLSKIDFAKLMVWLHNQSLSGTLRISRDQKSKFILFENGNVTSSYSEFPEDTFRAVIARMQLLPESQQMELEFETKTSNGEFAKHLIGKGYVTEREFLDVLKRQNQDIILSLFEWRQGDFVFYQDKFPETKTISLKFPFKWIIEKGTERRRLRRDIDNRIKEDAVFKIKSQDFRTTQISEHPHHNVRLVFETLAEPKQLRSIVNESGLTEFDVLTVLDTYVARNEIEMISSSITQMSGETRKILAEAEILFSKKRYFDAWTRMRKAVSLSPGLPDLQEQYKEYTRVFKEDLRSVISSLDQVPAIIGELDENIYTKFPRDSAIGYMLSRIDGRSSIKELGTILQMDREKLLVTIYILIKSGIVNLVAKKGPVPEDLIQRRRMIRQEWERIQNKNFFEILDVPTNATVAAIKNAYFKLAKKYHPDARADDEPKDLLEKQDAIFMKIRDAYRTLSDEEERKKYKAKLFQEANGSEDEFIKSRTKAQLQFSVGLRSLQSREYRTAMEYFRSAIDLDPYESRYYAKLAEVCTKNPRWYRAGILACKKAIQLEPESQTFYLILGTLYKLDDNFKEAEKQFIKVLQLDPGNLTAKSDLTSMGMEIPKNLAQPPPTDSPHAPMLRDDKKKPES